MSSKILSTEKCSGDDRTMFLRGRRYSVNADQRGDFSSPFCLWNFRSVAHRLVCALSEDGAVAMHEHAPEPVRGRQ